MKKKAAAIPSYGKATGPVTRAKAGTLASHGTVTLPIPPLKPDKKQRLIGRRKRVDSDENSCSVPCVAVSHNNKRKVLKDISDLCRENSYRNSLNAVKMQIKACTQQAISGQSKARTRPDSKELKISPTLSASNFLDPLLCNNLHALPCYDGLSLLLFFPTRDNADEIGFPLLRFNDECLKPEVVGLSGDIFRQREGLKYPRHRILKLLVVSSQADSSSPAGNSIMEGSLMATMLYSVNWFRVETRSVL